MYFLCPSSVYVSPIEFPSPLQFKASLIHHMNAKSDSLRDVDGLFKKSVRRVHKLSGMRIHKYEYSQVWDQQVSAFFF